MSCRDSASAGDSIGCWSRSAVGVGRRDVAGGVGGCAGCAGRTDRRAATTTYSRPASARSGAVR